MTRGTQHNIGPVLEKPNSNAMVTHLPCATHVHFVFYPSVVYPLHPFMQRSPVPPILCAMHLLPMGPFLFHLPLHPPCVSIFLPRPSSSLLPRLSSIAVFHLFPPLKVAWCVNGQPCHFLTRLDPFPIHFLWVGGTSITSIASARGRASDTRRVARGTASEVQEGGRRRGDERRPREDATGRQDGGEAVQGVREDAGVRAPKRVKNVARTRGGRENV